MWRVKPGRKKIHKKIQGRYCKRWHFLRKAAVFFVLVETILNYFNFYSMGI